VKSALPGSALGQADERAVLALAICGDAHAFSELVRRRQSWLRNLLRRLCRDPTLADDLAQQVFLQAWRSLRNLRSVNAFGAWLRSLAINTWRAHVRAGKAARTENADVDETAAPDSQVAGEQLDLDRALSSLSSDERVCIVLAYSEGMTHGEISDVTGLPLGTVKSHIRRGAERLRTLLHAYRPIEANCHVR
jgi:RNA polymerase sigma-70 factor (ECF subfamily)